MVCTAPESYYKRDPALFNGVRGLTKDARKALIGGAPLTVACGKCMDCRLSYAREWAIRCVHEASLYGDKNAFVTLTYNDEHLPHDHGLHYRDFQLFMHKLRKSAPGRGRFVMCGEYGEQFGRPHFHAILFNCSFEDGVFYKMSGDLKLFTSGELDRLWGNGFCSFGAVTVDSAGYVARYTTKKITGPAAGAAYQWLSPDGEVFDREAPFLHSSLKPGIGYGWFERYHSDVFPCDYLVHDGKKFPVPRYYSDLLDKWDAPAFQVVKRKRLLQARAGKAHPDNSDRRLRDRWEVRNLVSQNKRDLK